MPKNVTKDIDRIIQHGYQLANIFLSAYANVLFTEHSLENAHYTHAHTHTDTKVYFNFFFLLMNHFHSLSLAFFFEVEQDEHFKTFFKGQS